MNRYHLKFNLVIVLFLFKVYVDFEFQLLNVSSTTIPKIIWTFWDSDKVPGYIEKFADTFRQHNPNHEVFLVRKRTLGYYLGQDEANRLINWKHNDSPQRLADLVRLALLKKHGGIWLDPSVILYQPLDWVNNEGECVLFGEDGPSPLIDHMMIATVPNHPFISSWFEEIFNIQEYFSIGQYLDKVESAYKEGVNDYSQYLGYITARKAYHNHTNSVRLLSIWDEPLKYVIHGGLEYLCKENVRLAKIFSYFRLQVERDPNLEKCLFQATRSKLYKYNPNKYIYNSAKINNN